MIDTFFNHTIQYLSGKITRDTYIQICKEIYSELLSQPEKCMRLNIITAVPFIHEFAYCPYTERELRAQVQKALSVLDGKQPYSYSSFCKVPIPNETDMVAFQLYANYQDISLTDVQLTFDHSISNPLTIKELLYNLIFDIISKVNLEYPSESDFDYVNCGENISFAQVRERIFLLLSYYLGIRMCYIHICILPDNKTWYTIL